MPGQLMVSIEGTVLDAATRRRLSHPQIGGIILFARNFVSPDQLSDLTAEVCALKSPSLLVAVDQEGGSVQRFKNGFTRLPAMGMIGECYDIDPPYGLALARSTGIVLANELRECGIDFSFAPVMDLGPDNRAIGARAFHRDPKVVQRLAVQLAGGMALSGMRAVAKHFPGHGGVREDPHDELPCDERSMDSLREHDLMVYEHLETGVFTGVMTCHVLFPEIDTVPATLSRKLITDELRGRLGFRGPVFSDDLMMGALGAYGEASSLVRSAIGAGCDMALLCNNDAVTDSVIEYDDLPGFTEDARLRLESMRPAQDAVPDTLTVEQAREEIRKYT